MDFFGIVLEVIDTRSFTSIWYWLAVAAAWSAATRRVLGVPWDLLERARRDEDAAADMQDLARVTVNRLLRAAGSAGAVLLGVASGILTLLAVIGFAYGAEFAQAVFLLLAPLSACALLTVRAARGIAAHSASGADLRTRLARLRWQIQGVAVVAIFVSAAYGMLWSLRAGPFG